MLPLVVNKMRITIFDSVYDPVLLASRPWPSSSQRGPSGPVDLAKMSYMAKVTLLR